MARVVIVTGSAGLIGAESCRRFHAGGFDVVGVDNDMRARFFGAEASTSRQRDELLRTLPRYRHHDADIRDAPRVGEIFAAHGPRIAAVIHTAAQPSHDWAAREPLTDFGVNALGTLHLLEAARKHCPEAPFIFTSTNKVYGDAPNRLPLVELETRWEVDDAHPFHAGVPETMSIDQTLHSVFGAGKVAADVMVQEYGRYFGLPTVCFRGGCLTGPGHAGTELHGFLSYLMKCCVAGTPYRVFGYQAKQVRDNIHAADLVEAFWQFCEAPRSGAVYNIGGGRHSHCSMLEAIALCEDISGRKLSWEYVDQARTGDHIWYVSDLRRFQTDYPGWTQRSTLPQLLEDIHTALAAA